MKYALLVVSIFLSGCALTGSKGQIATIFQGANPSTTDAMALIEQVATAAPKPIKGNFVFDIKSATTIWPYTYLRTERDPQDLRGVTIKVFAGIEQDIYQQHGQSLVQHFTTGKVAVSGEATLEKVEFGPSYFGRPNYYYRVVIEVTSAQQIRMLK